MAVDVTPVFAAYFARSRGPVPGDPDARRPPDHGVSARLDGGVIDLARTFRAGSAYCCYEWGCHLALAEGKRWLWLRRELATRGLPAPARLELRLAVVVEAGRCSSTGRGPSHRPAAEAGYAFAPAQALRCQGIVAEGSSPGAERGAAADGGA